jgi:hypothetical protein
MLVIWEQDLVDMSPCVIGAAPRVEFLFTPEELFLLFVKPWSNSFFPLRTSFVHVLMIREFVITFKLLPAPVTLNRPSMMFV